MMIRAVVLAVLLVVPSGEPLLALQPVVRWPHTLCQDAPRLRMQAYNNRRGGGPSPDNRRRERPKKDRARPDFARNQITCYGCGAELQMEAAGRPGYLEPERYELKALHRQLRQTLCARCRSMTQGEILPAVVEGRLAVAEGAGVVTPEELRAQLLHLTERKALVVLLVDLSDVSGSFLPREPRRREPAEAQPPLGVISSTRPRSPAICARGLPWRPGVRDLIGPNPVMLVGTKADLLPRGTDPERVLAWMCSVLAARRAANARTSAQRLARSAGRTRLGSLRLASPRLASPRLAVAVAGST